MSTQQGAGKESIAGSKGPIAGPAPGTPPPPAWTPPTTQEFAERLARAANRSPEAYSLYLMTVINPKGVQTHHEPPLLAAQDGYMSAMSFTTHQTYMDVGLVAHSPDYRYENAEARVEGDTVILTYTHAMTLPNGERLSWPMANRFIVRNGMFDDITIVLNDQALKEIAKMMAVVGPPSFPVVPETESIESIANKVRAAKSPIALVPYLSANDRYDVYFVPETNRDGAMTFHPDQVEIEGAAMAQLGAINNVEKVRAVGDDTLILECTMTGTFNEQPFNWPLIMIITITENKIRRVIVVSPGTHPAMQELARLM